MICGGIISIILAIFELNITPYTWVYNHFIYYANQYIYKLASINFVAKDVYISLFSAILITIILYYLHPLFLKKSRTALVIIVACLVLLESDRFVQVFRLNHSNELVVFNQYKNSIIGIRNGRELTIFSENPIDEKTYNYTLKPYKIHQRIQSINFYNYQSKFKHSHFIKNENSIETKQFKFLLKEDQSDLPFYVLFHQSKEYSIENNGQLKRVIADASNYPSFIFEIENKFDSILWKTSEQGYFSLKF